MSIYQYFSAVCGAGKTHQFINRACEWANNGRKIIIFLPTKELIEKTIEHFLLNQPNAPPYKKFHGDVVSDSVARKLTDYLKGSDGKGQIIFTTQAVLPYLPSLSIRKYWHCFVDEAPQVFQHFSYEASGTEDLNGHEALPDLITFEHYKGDYSRVGIKKRKRAELERIAKDEGIDETTQEIARTLLNKHYRSFVKSQTFQELKDGSKSKLSFFSILMPTVLDGFASVTMASANFQDTFVYQLWSQLGVEFRADKELASSLRFQEHTNGHLITIKYAIEKNSSKKLRRSKLNPDSDDETTVQDAYVAAINTEFHGAAFAFQANKDVANGVFGGKGHRLPNVPHGLNTFSHINNIAFLSSLNPHSDVFPFLKTMGIDGEAIRRAIYYQGGYQSVLRTSIRDPHNQDPKIIIVPDRSLADYLNGLFPDSKIEKLKTTIVEEKPKKIGRPRKHQPDKDRKAEYRQRQKQKLLNELLALQTFPYDLNQLEIEQTQPRIGDKKGIRRRLYSYFVPDPLTISIYRDKYANVPAGYVHWEDVEDFIADLKSFNTRQLKNKESNFLISPAIFNPNHPDREIGKKRGLGNIAYLRHLWLDFENGELQPNELAKLFPHLRIVVVNTYNHTADEPRFRAIFPTSQPVTPAVYEILWANIAAKLEEAGCWVGKGKPKRGSNLRLSGLDVSKRTPTSLFYAPCQAKNPADSFFRYYNEPDRQLLNPRLWIENNIVPFPVPFIAEDQPSNGHCEVNWEKVTMDTEEWRKSSQHPHEGNDRFFAYAVDLREAGMNLPAIERKLIEEVAFGRHPNERLAQISNIMDSLKNSRRKAG